MLQVRPRNWTVVILVIGLIWGCALRVDAQQMPFFVVVHADNDLDMLSRDALSDIFLKKTTKWSDGSAAMPIDLAPESAIRKAFSEEIHKRSVDEVQAYWSGQEDAKGVTRPTIAADQKEALKLVRENRGAIAYVSTSADFTGVNIIAVVNPPVVIKKVPPNYTQSALRFRVQGDVVLRLQINEEGEVDDVTVIEGLKHGLTEEAVQAVKKWRFKPATTGGMAVSAEIDVTVNFRF